jgi:Flp pilus assembly protein TadD
VASVSDAHVYELFTTGRMHLTDGDPRNAIAPLEEARDLEPDKGSIREALGTAYLRTRRYRDAEAELVVAVELAPNDAYAYFLLGRAQERLGQIALARGSYKMATWLQPSSETYRRALAELPAA